MRISTRVETTGRPRAGILPPRAQGRSRWGGPRAGRVGFLALFGLAAATLVGGLQPLPRPRLSHSHALSSTAAPAGVVAHAWGRPHGSQEDSTEALSGLVEAIPQNVYRATPYNDWPLFEIKVREGQRLRFRRVDGRWVGDDPVLFVQFETPAEVDGKKEVVEIAELERRSATIALELLRAELEKDLKAADIREQNARQQFERVDRLRDRMAAAPAEAQKARNSLDLARTQREQVASLLAKKAQGLSLQVDLAEHRLRLAQSELDLADFKREMSWARVPVGRGRFEEVVVTRVLGASGDVPSSAGKKDVWVEVVDDRTLHVRCFLPAVRVGRLAVGGKATVRQGDLAYGGEVASIGAVADSDSRLVPLLVRVRNEGLSLKIGTEVAVDIDDTRGLAR